MGVLGNELFEKYSQIPNLIVTDINISHGSFRVYSYLASKPSGWIIRNEDIKINLNIKQNNTLSSYFKELLSSGWISRTRVITEKGKFNGGYDYRINASPSILWENHIMENPTYGKMHKLNKTKSKNTPSFSNMDAFNIMYEVKKDIEKKGKKNNSSNEYYTNSQGKVIKKQFINKPKNSFKTKEIDF